MPASHQPFAACAAMKCVALASLLSVQACGTDKREKGGSSPAAPSAPPCVASSPEPGAAPEGAVAGEQQSPGEADGLEVIRGQWSLAMRAQEQGQLRLEGSSQGAQTITGRVAAKVVFTLSAASFGAEVIGDGMTSYGTLDVTDIRDNDLRVCGLEGNSACQEAFIRIFTTGTPGPGLWSSVESLGLPIQTSGTVIGLNTAGAIAISSVSIGTRRVLKLSDFTASSSLQIPVAVDFTDAAAGAYESTLIVQYGLR